MQNSIYGSTSGSKTSTSDINSKDIPFFYKDYDEFCLRLIEELKIIKCPVIRELDEKKEDIVMGEKLGEGNFGLVRRAKVRKISENDIAVKFIYDIDFRVGSKEKNPIKLILCEVLSIITVGHPNIPNFFGVFISGDNKLGLMFQFIDGVTLNDYWEKNKLSKTQKLDLIIQLCDILKSLMQKNVIHRDVKPKNIMVDKTGKVYLIDFGLSKINKRTCSFTKEGKGSPAYAAPEAYMGWTENAEENEVGVTPLFDVWSTGCVIVELFTTLKPFFYQNNSHLIYNSFSKGKIPYDATEMKKDKKKFALWNDFTKAFPDLYELVCRCFIYLEKDQEGRIDIIELGDSLRELMDKWKEDEEV